MLGPSSWSAKRMARVGAILSPLSAVPDGFSTYMLTRVFVRNNPAATAAKLLGAETMFRLGMVSELFALAMFVASAILLYAVFKPADRHVALLFLVTTIMGATMQALNVVADGAALTFLKGGTGIAG